MLKPALRRVRSRLTPETYARLRAGWWYGRHYLPRLAMSRVIRRRPVVRGFPASGSSALVADLHAINVLAPTALCLVMARCGSDKGFDRHDYTPIYSALFSRRRLEPLRIFELGLGTTNPAVAFNMGAYGRPGASLRGWREFFPRASIFGADIDRDVLFQEDRIATFYCDQQDRDAIRALWAQPPLQEGADIIVDDGLHEIQANAIFLEESLAHLRPSGVYAIEDIGRTVLDAWCDLLETTCAARYPDHEFALVQLPNRLNDYDNNLLIIRKGGSQRRHAPGFRVRQADVPLENCPAGLKSCGYDPDTTQIRPRCAPDTSTSR